MILYFNHCLLVEYILQPLYVATYLSYIGPGGSDHCKCNMVRNTSLIHLIHHKKPLCHPCKIAPSHVMMMEQCDISSRWDKNLCLLEEGPWVPIVSLDICTSRAPQCCLCSHHHNNMSPPLARKNSMCLVNSLLIFSLVDLCVLDIIHI